MVRTPRNNGAAWRRVTDQGDGLVKDAGKAVKKEVLEQMKERKVSRRSAMR